MKKIVDVFYVATSLGGAALLALDNPSLRLLAYIVFIASSLSGLWLLKKSKDASKSLTVVSIAFLIINLIGLVQAMKKLPVW